MNENIIILKKDSEYEAWGSITEICSVYGFSYNYLKRLKFPFIYKGIEFIKTPFRQKKGIKS